MSLNKFMHPRNPYRIPPDFKQLAVEYPEFRKYLKQDLSGKVKLDFKDDGAVRQLTKTLLEKDFGLVVDIPPDRLVPTLPLRINYLLTIEDLLRGCRRQNKTTTAKEEPLTAISGIDIGTGASCIYPLLAARQFKWKMVGTEIDKESVKCARMNVTNNRLEDLITVKEIEDDGESVLRGAVGEQDSFDFCMCNPPFFKDSSELEMAPKSRSPSSRNPPRNCKSGAEFELVAPGGETAFIQRIIDDSVKLKNKIRIYTVMVGHKRNVKLVKDSLRRVSPLGVGTGELCQGRTMRWVVAWTFSQDVCLKGFSPKASKEEEDKPPLRWFYQGEHKLQHVQQQTIDILNNLKMEIEELERNENSVTILMVARQNTWSHSRKRKRQNLKRNEISSADVSSLTSADTTLLEPSTVTTPPPTVDCGTVSVAGGSLNGGSQVGELPSPPKKPKVEGDGGGGHCVTGGGGGIGGCDDDAPVLLEGALCLSMMDDDLLFTLKYISGSGGRDAANQVLQFLKNSLSPTHLGSKQ